MVKSIDFTDSQCIKVKIISNSIAVAIYVIYRPPNYYLTSFLSDYYTYFTSNIIYENTIILGDFNIKMNLNIYESVEFNRNINSLNQEQHITFQTHLLGNRLYLIITIQNSNIITNLHTINNTISDHYTIKANINFHKIYTDKITIKYRPLSIINYNTSKYNFANTYKIQDITNFNKTLNSLINLHSPIKYKIITNRTKTPWYNKSLNKLKNNVRKK